MSKLTLSDFASLANETSAIQKLNENFAAIEAAIDNTLSRDGNSPNTMESELDMNGNSIINIDSLDVEHLLIDGVEVGVTGLTIYTPADNSITDVKISTASNLYDRLTDEVWITDSAFGATLSGTQSATDRVTAIQAAIDYGYTNDKTVYFPEGTWIIESALRFRTGGRYRMAGIDRTIFQLSETANEDSNVWEPYAFDGTITDITFTGGFTCDGNWDRPTVTGSGSVRPGSSCFITGGSRRGYVDYLKCTGGVLHGLDISNGGHSSGGGNYIPAAELPVGWNVDDTPVTSAYHPDNESYKWHFGYVYAADCGDDGITSHYSYDCTIDVAISVDSGLRNAGISASNSIEIDDGSRFIHIGLAICKDGNRGLAIKSHKGYATPYGCTVDRVYITNCNQGVVFDSDPDELLQVRQCTINSIIVRDPMRIEETAVLEMQALTLSNVKEISIGRVIAIARGDETVDEWAQAVTWGPACQISSACTDITVEALYARNWNYDEQVSTSNPGVLQVTSTNSDIYFGSIKASNCGWIGIRDTGCVRINYGYINLYGRSSPLTNSVGLYFSDPLEENNASIGNYVIRGYTNEAQFASYYTLRNVRSTVLTAVTSTEYTNSSNTTFQTVNELKIPLAPSVLYLYEAWLLVKAAATTTGLEIALDIPADATLYGGMNIQVGASSAVVGAALTGDATVSIPAPSTFSTTVATPVYLSAIVLGGANGFSCAPTFRSEVNTSLVTVIAKSVARATRLS